MPPDPQLKSALAGSGLVLELGLAIDEAESLLGGITNTSWRVPSRNGDVVVKLYTTRPSSNPLFPNHADDEANALRLLAPKNISPELLGASSGDTKLIVYKYVAGTHWAGEFGEAAELLGRLHESTDNSDPTQRPLLPNRRLEGGAKAAITRGDQMLRRCDRSPTTERVSAERPHQADPVPANPVPDNPVPDNDAVFLHGDPTAANFIQTHDGLRLIDWQCPAIGDPVHDLAIFLSPMMMLMHGEDPPSTDNREAFLLAYPNQAAADRYRSTTSSWHWQLAAYGAFRANQLEAVDPDLGALYRAGTILELDLARQ